MKESSVELKDTLTSKTCKMDSQICIFFLHYFNFTDYKCIIKCGTYRASNRSCPKPENPHDVTFKISTDGTECGKCYNLAG